MLRRFSLQLALILIGIVLIAIAFINLWSLPVQVENSISQLKTLSLFEKGVDEFGSFAGPSEVSYATYMRIFADRNLLQSIYCFVIGIVLLSAGLSRVANRQV